MKKGNAWLASRERRIGDVIAATAALPVAAPLAGIALGLARYENGAPAMVRQPRFGLHGHDLVGILKMHTIPGDFTSHISPNGHAIPDTKPASRLIRRTHADELLQLVHILQGDMTWVGPRPIVPSERDEINDHLSPSEQREWAAARSLPVKIGAVNILTPEQQAPGYVHDPYRVAMGDIAMHREASPELDAKIMRAVASSIMADIALHAAQGLGIHTDRRLDLPQPADAGLFEAAPYREPVVDAA